MDHRETGMTNRLWATAIERATALAGPLAHDELPDAELLRRFLATRDEPAFAAIVRRHGPLVWGVCRHLMPSEADAEDAFQATFLVLVRGAGRITKPNALGAWLHRVAGRVCRNGLRAVARRRKHERCAAVAEATSPVDGATWDRWQTSVHEEIDRLPDALRVPFVLCVLQGVRQPDAAGRLGWKLGTVSGRICKAKQALAEALTRRGLAGTAVLAGLVGVGGPLSAALVGKGTVVVRPSSAPGGGISTTVHELARGATGVVMGKTKLLAAALLTATFTIGVGSNLLSTAGAQSANPPAGGDRPAGGFFQDPNPLAGAQPPRGGSGAGSSLSARGPRVEYQFLPKPKGADAFKKLLTQQGADGWEYAGHVPGDDELIFQRTSRPGGMMSGMGGMGTPGLGGFSGGSGMPGMSPFGGGSGFSGNAFPGGSFGSPAPKKTPSNPGGTDGRGGRGRGTPDTGGSDADPAAPGGASDLNIQLGETIRHKMKTNQTIDRVYSDNSKSVEVTLDPTDAKRVIIRGLTPQGARLDLTDANGTKERYTVRVR